MNYLFMIVKIVLINLFLLVAYSVHGNQKIIVQRVGLVNKE